MSMKIEKVRLSVNFFIGKSLSKFLKIFVKYSIQTGIKQEIVFWECIDKSRVEWYHQTKIARL